MSQNMLMPEMNKCLKLSAQETVKFFGDSGDGGQGSG